MKDTTYKYIALLSIVAGMLFMDSANAQYSSSKNFQLSDLSEKLDNAAFINSELLHEKSPDTLINRTKNTDILVEVRSVTGDKDPGLIDRNGNTSKILKAGSVSRLNEKSLRRGVGIHNKVELIVTIPGVRNDSTGYYDIKQVAWTLGAGHNPTYSKLNYLGRKEGYQIIFVYENGIAPRSEESSEKHRLSHIQAHICDPGDPACSPIN